MFKLYPNVPLRITYPKLVCQQELCVPGGRIRLGMSAKDSRVNFRIRSELKKRLESVAAAEGRSVAQICDAFLQAGLVAYDKAGTKYIRRFLARRQEQPTDD